MHLVRNAAFIRPPLPGRLHHRTLLATTHASNPVNLRQMSSVVPEVDADISPQSPPVLVSDTQVTAPTPEPSFSVLKQFSEPKQKRKSRPPQPAPITGEKKKKKQKKKEKIAESLAPSPTSNKKELYDKYTELLERSQGAISHQRDLAESLINHLLRVSATKVNDKVATKNKKVMTSSVEVNSLMTEEDIAELLATNASRKENSKGWALSNESNEHKPSPPHVQTKAPMLYTRRLEGIFMPLNRPVLEDIKPITEPRPIPLLEHKLDRVLFSPGVHWMKDPRTEVYNFGPWLENLPDVTKFGFERLPGFVKSSRDNDLWALARREGRKFAGSTSSLTGMLCHMYFLLSGNKGVNLSSLSQPFQNQSVEFTPAQRMGSSVLLNHNDGVYAIDSSKHPADDHGKNVLLWQGTMLEKFLTMPPEQFSRLMRDSPNPLVDTGPSREAYRYAKSNSFVMRSQLDCRDKRLPGTGVFDLKTRAALPVRLDVLNYQEYAGYQIRTLQGLLESFEREYYDLIRSAFLKYSFQVRIGAMDGVFVAHHNSVRMFGFQYIPLSEMEACLYGASSRGDRVFEKCVLLLEEVAKEVVACFPGQSVRCLLETRENMMRAWVEPDNHDEASGPRPIVQLDIESVSYVEEAEVRGSTAISSDSPWVLHWSISTSSSSDEVKRASKDDAEARRFRAWNLPSGVDVADMQSLWDQIDYGGKRLTDSDGKPSSGSTFDPASFQPAAGLVQVLRDMSREAMEDLSKTQDKPKVCLDQSWSSGFPRRLDTTDVERPRSPNESSELAVDLEEKQTESLKTSAI